MSRPFILGMPRFPSPPERYDRANEAQFRQLVERLLQSSIQQTNDTTNAASTVTETLQFVPDNRVDVGDYATPYRPRTVYAATSVVSPSGRFVNVLASGLVAATTGSVVGALTVGGDVAVDTSVLAVNASTNRVGINTALSATTLDLDVTGQFGIKPSGSGYPTALSLGFGGRFYAVHTSGDWGFVVARASVDTAAANLAFYHTRNADASVRTALVSGDQIGRMTFQGPSDSSTVNIGATITAVVNAAVSAGALPTELRFSVVASGDANPATPNVTFAPTLASFAQAVTVTGVLTGSTEVRTPSLDTVGATDLVLQRNNVTQLTLASLVATFAGTASATQLISTIATGTAPLVVTSTTKVTNLNADLLDDQSSAFYQDSSNQNAGTLPSARLTGAYSDITGVGTLASGAVPASLVTAGTFGAGNYVFPSKLTPLGSMEFGATADGAGFSLTFLRDLTVASSIGARVYTTNNGVVTEAMRFTRDDVQMYRRASVYDAAGIVARWQNSAATVDVRQWDFRINSSNGQLELRSTLDAGTTVVNALQVAHATGNVTFSGNVAVGTNSTNSLTVGATAGAATTNIRIRAAAGNARSLGYQSGSSDRWALDTTSTAESGSNAGSNFQIRAFDDSGTAIDTPLFISRAAGGNFAIARPVTMSSTLAVTTSVVVGTDPGTTALIRSSGSVTATAYRATTGLYLRNNDNNSVEYSGASAASTGGNLKMYGSTHATQANDIELRSGSTVRLTWDDSAATWLLPAALSTSAQITSTLATGTSPFVVASTTKVANLNADLLDDQTGSYYLDLANVTGTLDETLGGTGLTSYALGDILYASASNTLSKLAGNTTTTGQYLKQTGNGSVSAAPVWDTLTAADVGAGVFPAGSYSGMASFTASNITSLGDVAAGNSVLNESGVRNTFSSLTFSGTTVTVKPTGNSAVVTIAGNNSGASAALTLYGTSHANAGRIDLVSGGTADLNLTAGSGLVKVTTDLQVASGKVYKVNGTQVVAARDTGWTAFTGTTDKATAYATGSVTLVQLAERVAQLQAALTTHGLIGA